MLAAWLASTPSGFTALSAAGIPTFPDPSRTARAARRLLDAARTNEARAAQPAMPFDAGPVERLIRSSGVLGGGMIGEGALLPVLGTLGLRVPQLRRVRDAAEAISAFAAMDVPRVAVKIDSTDITHKTEVGGVVLGIDTPVRCGEAVQQVLASVRARRPDARIDGVLLAEMAQGQAEAMIGISRDPVLGPFVAVGLGGIFVEVLSDVVFRAAPFDEVEATALLRSLKAWPLLAGGRNLPRLDVAALAHVVAAVSRLAVALPDIAELDLNPVLVGREGEGVVIVDALLRTAQAT
jgi:acyl-CoA synthetase (NDP forming)